MMSLIKAYNSYIGLGLLVFGLIVIWKTLSLGIISIIIGVIVLGFKNRDREEKIRGRSDVARNPNTPPETLQTLARDEDTWVRGDVALNPNTPPETLQTLARDEETWVRGYVARNPNTPPETLQTLAQDEKIRVRGDVALNPNTPPETLQTLARDEETRVRDNLASNPNFDLSHENTKSLTNSEQQSCYFHYNQGNAYKRKGSYKEAILEYTHAISKKTDFDDAYLNRGIAKFSLLNINEAIYDFNQAIKINPKNPNAYFCRGECYKWIGNSGSLAIEDFTQAIRLNPSDDESYKKRGLTYINLGKYKEALEDLNQAISINKENANAYFCRASIYIEKGDSTQAKNDLKKSAELYEEQGIKPSAEKAWELYNKL